MTDVVVRAEGLRKSYGSTPVLQGVDLTLHRGEVLALLGPNGAGKTTTVKILSTLLPFDGGTATVAGFDVARETAQVRRVISLTGQQVALDLKLTGRENLTMVARLSRLPRHAVKARVKELLDAVDLADVADRRVSTYSGGMRRRLDLAAGLAARPQVLFLDEPTTGLDPRSRRALWDLVRDVVASGTSLFLTTQYLEEADELADRIALIDGGRVVAEGTADELKRRIGQASVELDLPDGTTRVLPTTGEVADVRRLLQQIEADGVVPTAWRLREPSLDDVFLTLTGHKTRDAEAAHSGSSVENTTLTQEKKAA